EADAIADGICSNMWPWQQSTPLAQVSAVGKPVVWHPVEWRENQRSAGDQRGGARNHVAQKGHVFATEKAAELSFGALPHFHQLEFNSIGFGFVHRFDIYDDVRIVTRATALS